MYLDILEIVIEKVKKIYNKNRLSSKEQIKFLSLYATLRSDNAQDKWVLEELINVFTQAKGASSQEVAFCKEALEAMESGLSIYEIMQDWFGNELVTVMKASRKSRTAKASLDALVMQMSKWKSAKSNYMTNMITASAFFIVMFIVHYCSSAFLLPSLGKGSAIEHWGIIATPFGEYALWINKYFLIISFTIITTLTGYIVGIYTYTGRFREDLDNLPLYGLYRDSTAAKLFSMLSVLCNKESSLLLTQALEIVDSSKSKYECHHIDIMKERTETGDFSLIQLDTGLLPVDMRARLLVAGRQQGGVSLSYAFELISRSLTDDIVESLSSKGKWQAQLLYFSGLALMMFTLFSIFEIVISKISL